VVRIMDPAYDLELVAFLHARAVDKYPVALACKARLVEAILAAYKVMVF
jgi:hypothetical protein